MSVMFYCELITTADGITFYSLFDHVFGTYTCGMSHSDDLLYMPESAALPLKVERL